MLTGKMLLKRLTCRLPAQMSINTRGYLNLSQDSNGHCMKLNGHLFERDEWTNVTPKILSYLDKKLHMKHNHPLSILRRQIVNHFYKSFVGRTGNPIFSVYDDLRPIVTVQQNFDSLLIVPDHPSRKKTDCYYLNKGCLLRAHMTAHQAELISMGLNNFLMIGDVYRRDEIDSSHYPVFHQADGVRLCTKDEVFRSFPEEDNLQVFETRGGQRTELKQEHHTLEATKLMEHELKDTLSKMSKVLFGPDVKMRWVETQFPFTHPSWELEVLFKDDWMEVLGCGIIEHTILNRAGAGSRIGWAFGLGLERLAMRMYQIPDIRLFWSNDSGFLNQFSEDNPSIVYKPISNYPQCINDISFWIPNAESFSPNDFYDIVRDVGEDIIEQISLVDNFKHPKSGKTSHCYRIIYRHMEKTLTQEEVNAVHKKIEELAVQQLKVEIR